mmetsp:Transcript_14046/g.33985  ORF Transcript_14046/g.33985 Transcript_14046/m.33985 type:complete len:394 (+) Transcript_14046:869-2050(+)
MTSPSACTACCVPEMVPRASGKRSDRSARYARSPPSAAERPAPSDSRAGTSASTVRHCDVARSLSAMTSMPAIIICLRPQESTRRPAGRLRNSMASAGAESTMPLALPLRPMLCAYSGSAGSSAPTPTKRMSCEESKMDRGSNTRLRGNPNIISSPSPSSFSSWSPSHSPSPLRPSCTWMPLSCCRAPSPLRLVSPVRPCGATIAVGAGATLVCTPSSLLLSVIARIRPLSRTPAAGLRPRSPVCSLFLVGANPAPCCPRVAPQAARQDGCPAVPRWPPAGRPGFPKPETRRNEPHPAGPLTAAATTAEAAVVCRPVDPHNPVRGDATPVQSIAAMCTWTSPYLSSAKPIVDDDDDRGKTNFGLARGEEGRRNGVRRPEGRGVGRALPPLTVT